MVNAWSDGATGRMNTPLEPEVVPHGEWITLARSFVPAHAPGIEPVAEIRNPCRQGLPPAPARHRFATGLLIALAYLHSLACGPAATVEPRQGVPAMVQRALEIEDWSAFLDALAGDRLTNATLRLVTVRALSETGRLPDELFSRIHQPGEELLSTSGLDQYSGAAHLGETLLQIGYLNGAERLAFDSLEMESENAPALRTLVRLHVIRGLTNAAGIFLNRLDAYPEQRLWVARFRAALETNSPATADPSLARIRANLLTRDRIVSGLTTERLLKQALEANPTNRLALDFLLAHFLLGRDLLSACSTLAKAPRGRNGLLPRHYAEAVLLHRSLYPGISLNTLLPRVPPPVAEGFDRFQNLLKTAPGDPERLRPDVGREFGNTYWYYYVFGRLGPPAENARSAQP